MYLYYIRVHLELIKVIIYNLRTEHDIGMKLTLLHHNESQKRTTQRTVNIIKLTRI